MTPYWPSPLGATRRRLAPRKGGESFLFNGEYLQSQSPRAPRFPRANRGIKWVAEADLPLAQDFDLGSDRIAPEAG